MKAIFKRINRKYGKSKIKQIQTFLKEFDMYGGAIDGIYGQRTAYAVSHYQRLHPPLMPDGIIGKKTLKAMFPKRASYAKQVIASSHGMHDKSMCKKLYPHEDKRTQRDLKRFYGDPAKEEPGKHLVSMTLPYKMYLSWNANIGVSRIFMHKKVIESYQGWFEDIAKEYDKETIEMMGLNQYGGAYNPRRMRGASRWSTHAYGIAIDLDPAHNQLRWHEPRARFSRSQYNKVWEFAANHGLYSLGVHHNYDYMHVQAAYR